MHAWGSVAPAVDRVVPEEIVDKGRAGVHASVLEFPSGGVVFLVSISAESTCFRVGYVAAPYIAIVDNVDGFLSSFARICMVGSGRSHVHVRASELARVTGQVSAVLVWEDC